MFNTFGVQCFINSVFILFSPAHRVSRVKQKTKTNLALVLTSKDFCLSCDIIAEYNMKWKKWIEVKSLAHSENTLQLSN